MAIERDTDDAVPAPAPWRWQHFCRGIEVYTRDPEPPAGEPFTGCYRGSVRTGGEWRVYPDEVSPDLAAGGQAEGGSEEERMAAARGEVERRVAARKGVGAMTVGTNDGSGGAGVLDLAAWKREAGEAAPLDAAATRGPWEDMFAHWGKAEIVHFNSLPYDDRANTINGRQYDRVTPYIEPGNAAFIAAARTGWPRDAARVLALADRCAALEEALAEALDGWEGTVSDVGVTSYHTIQRLRALAAGGAEKEPSR